jgi:hypothetical protein
MLLSSKFSDIWNSAVENAKCQEYPTPHVAASLKKMRSKSFTLCHRQPSFGFSQSLSGLAPAQLS